MLFFKLKKQTSKNVADTIFIGSVKKLGMMKIVHEKYKTNRKQDDSFMTEFKNSFNGACETNKELSGLLGKTQEIMNPIKVKQLFEAISDEVLFGVFLQICKSKLIFYQPYAMFFVVLLLHQYWWIHFHRIISHQGLKGIFGIIYRK